MLGLGHLNPCPPLLKDIYQLFNNQRDLFDDNRLKEYLKKALRNISGEKMEEVAAIFFKQCGYEVEVLPRSTPAFDLLLTRAGQFSATTIGVQVKAWKRKFNKKSFKDWENTIELFDRSEMIARVIFFLQETQQKAVVDCGKSVRLRKELRALTQDTEFISLNYAVEMLWQQQSCLPSVYKIISAEKQSRVPTKIVTKRTTKKSASHKRTAL